MEQAPPSHGTRNSVLLYLAVSFIAFFPSLVLDKAYFANDLLYGYGPIRAFIKNQFASGHFPLWNPFLWGGQPFFADPNAMMLYPLNYLTLLFPLSYGYGVFFFIHMFLAALGAHLWLKTLRLSDSAARVGALLYALSGYFWWELIHPPILADIALFPWFLACLERLRREATGANAFAAGLAYALIFVAGNFQIALSIFYAGLFYYLFRLVEKDGPLASLKTFFSGGNWKKGLLVALFTLWGGFPLFFHAIPAAELASYSHRESNLDYNQFAGQFSMKPSTVYEFLFPALGVAAGDTLESAIQQVTDSVNIDNKFLGAFGYLGIWLPFLAFLAFERKDRRFLWGLSFLSLVSLLLAFGRYFPLHQFLCVVAPGFKLVRAPFRFIDVYVVCLTALAAFGWQALEYKGGDRQALGKPGFIGLLYGLVFLVIALAKPSQTWPEILALVLGLAGLSLWCWTESWQKLGRLFLLTALVLPLLFSGWAGFSLGSASNFDFKGKFPVTSQLGQTYKAARFYLDANNTGYPVESRGASYRLTIPDNAPEVFGFRVTRGYNPIYLKKPADLNLITQKAYIQLFAVRGFLTGRDSGDQAGFDHRTLDSIHLYEQKTPPAFVTAPFQVKVVPNDAERLAAMKNPAFNPADEAFLTEVPPAEIFPRMSGAKAQLHYDMAEDEADRQVFSVTLDKESLVVFSEIMFPGWKAFIDGQPTALFTANHVFRSVFVPQGSHRVEFRFEPSWWRPLLITLALWTLSALVYGVFLLKRKGTALEPPQA